MALTVGSWFGPIGGMASTVEEKPLSRKENP